MPRVVIDGNSARQHSYADDASCRDQCTLLFISPSAYPLGGVATWLDYVSAGLNALGWCATVGLTAGRLHDAVGYLAEHPSLRESVAIVNRSGSQEGRVRAIERLILSIAPAVVVSSNIVDTCSAIARIRTRSKGHATRLLMTLHGIQPDLFEDIERERDVLDGVACSNKLALALAAQAGVAAERLYYVPYGVPMPSSPTLAADAVAHAVERRLRIAYVGRLEQWQKRVLELPPICDELVRCGVDFELLVAGSGPDEVTLRQQLAGHVAAGRVIWLGHVPASDVAERVYRRADVLINPSLWETGPIVVWEAMAHGVAVVTSRYVGCGLEGALQDDHNCLMYPIGDVTRAATAIASLTDRQRRQRLVDGGRTLVRTRYSIAASVDAWDRAIRAVLSQPPMPIPTQLRRDVQPSGRLDRWLGVRYGEMVRRALGVRFAHSEPGGEWPHSYGTKAIDDEAFWARAKALDACESLAEQRP